MRVLVTGASGFVGSCVARRLVEHGHDVRIFTRRDSDCRRIADLLPHLENRRLDLRDDAAVKRAVMEIRPEGICHLATYGGFSFQQDSATIMGVNMLGTVNLLRACASVGFRSFINTGSSSEYGLKHAAMRECDLLEPLGDYGVSKAAATLFCSSEGAEKGLPVVTLRIFSPYGPWDDPRRLVPYVASSLLRQEVPRLSTPSSVRDYVFIDDVVDFYLLLLEKPAAGGAIFNVGSGGQHSIGEVVGLLGEVVGGYIEPQWGSAAPARVEPAVWCADIGKARTGPGWQPRTTLREGLATTVTWIREHLAFYG